MALSDESILSDASELVTELVADLEKLDLPPEAQLDALNDVRKIITLSAAILVTIYDKQTGKDKDITVH